MDIEINCGGRRHKMVFRTVVAKRSQNYRRGFLLLHHRLTALSKAISPGLYLSIALLTFILPTTGFIINSSGAAFAAEAPQILPTNGYWRQFAQAGSRAGPTQADIKGLSSFEHGTYQMAPYYAFVHSEKTGNSYLISDSNLRARLDLISDSVKIRQISGTGASKGKPVKVVASKYRITFEKGTKKVRDMKTGILSINDESCGNEKCFIVSGTGRLPALPTGSWPNGHYVLTTPLPENAFKVEQTLGSVFTPKAHAFNVIQGCFDITLVNPSNFQDKNCTEKSILFDLPAGTSKNYSQSGDSVVPYGWLYSSVSGGSNKNSTSMISSSADMMNSMQKSTGFHVGGEVSGGLPGLFSVKAKFNVTKNQSVSQKIQNLYSQEQTYSAHEYLELQYVYVLDKQNVRLGETIGGIPGFKAAIEDLRTLQKRDGEVKPDTLDGFIELWGTHYAFAATFGARGSALNSYSKSEVQQLIDKGVKLDSAWSAGLSVTVFGQGGGVDGGQTSSQAQEQYQNMQKITSKGFTNASCVGGLSCSEDGQVSPGAWVPIYVDLRPLSELFGPPFYKDEDTAILLRDQLEKRINLRSFAAPHPSFRGPSTNLVQLEDGEVTCPRCPGQNITFQVASWQWTLGPTPPLVAMEYGCNPKVSNCFTVFELPNNPFLVQADTTVSISNCQFKLSDTSDPVTFDKSMIGKDLTINIPLNVMVLGPGILCNPSNISPAVASTIINYVDINALIQNK